MAPRCDGTLGNVLDGDGQAVPQPDPGVDGAEAALAQNVADAVGASKRLAVAQQGRRRRCRRCWAHRHWRHPHRGWISVHGNCKEKKKS